MVSDSNLQGDTSLSSAGRVGTKGGNYFTCNKALLIKMLRGNIMAVKFEIFINVDSFFMKMYYSVSYALLRLYC